MSETPTPPPSFARRALELLNPFLRPTLIVAAHFAAFFVARVALLLSHPKDFAGLTGGEVAWAFVRGLRFDGAILFLVIGIPVFLLMLPFRRTQGRLWQGVLGWTCYATLILFSLVLGSDVVYFGYVGRHVGAEIGAPGEALEAVALTGAVQYLLPLLLFVAAAAGVFIAWRRMMRMAPPPPGPVLSRLGIALVCFGLMYAGSRGTFGGKRTKIVHAFDGARNESAAYLALNGPFTILHSLDFGRSAKADFFPWEEAVRTARETLFAAEETGSRPDYPLLRARPAKATPKPNVVLIMLESWDAFFTDAHRREMGLEPLGLTPNYDALAREGVLFSKFYAAGQKSMDGMCALLAGFPTLPRTPYLGRGMEQSGLPFLGRLAKQEGYETLFLQSSRRDSFRNDAISAMAGFSTYLGAEDIPAAPAPVSRAILGGAAWDHEMFAEANRRLAATKRPFLAFLYTATTHAPFAWPGREWERFPAGDRAGRYKNSLAYADAALGRFFAGAREAGLFESTIFILTSDHIGGPGGVSRDDPATFHHIPGLILAPGLKPGVDPRVASQLDVIPTIADLAGWGSPQSALGRSLLSDGPGRGALCVAGELILRIEQDGCVLHNLNGRVRGTTYRDGADLDAVEKRLLSVYQVAAVLLKQNRLYPTVRGARKE